MRQYFTKFHGKTVHNGYKSTIVEYCDKSTMNTEVFYPFFIKYFFPAG